jgi:transcriptional regulator with XRE-family HTH domain
MSQATVVQYDERARVITMAVLRAAEALGLTGKELSRVLGVSEPSVTRMRRGDYRIDEQSKTFELAALFVRFFRSLDAITAGDAEAARRWLRNENLALGGIPAAKIQSIAGLTHGLAYLDSRRAPL